MGRPIKKKFFGSDNVNDSLTYSDAGGESVSSLTINGANSYSAGTTISFTDSPIGGTTAQASITVVTPAAGAPGNGNVASYSITTAGTGYLTAPAVTFTKPGNVVVDGVTGFYALGGSGTVVKFSSGVTSGIYVGMVANAFFATTTLGNPTRVIAVNTTTGNVTLSTANTSAITSPISFGDVGREGSITAVLASPSVTANTIQANAWVTSSQTYGNIADIVSQKSSRRYRVTNAQGTAVCRLVPTGLNGVNSPTVAAVIAAKGPTAVGEMTIIALDSANGAYLVGKLESRTALVFPAAINGYGAGSEFTANSHVRWTSTGSAVLNTTVKLLTND